MADMNNLVKNTIKIGLAAPLRVLHVTDAHLVSADERDSARKRELAARQRGVFTRFGGETYAETFFSWLDYGRENCDVIVNTGDVIDFTSEALFDELYKTTHERCGDKPVIFAAGNHEYSQFVGEAYEDDAYRNQSFSRVQACVPVNLDFAARVIGGVNFVSLDNAYYNVTERQLDLLKVEAARPYPIVLCLHVPLWHPAYLDALENSLAAQSGTGECPRVLPESLSLCGAPFKVTSRYTGGCAIQQFTTPVTQAFYDFVTHDPAFRLLLTGHTHKNFECRFENGLVQLNTGLACQTAREITIE